jgi:hypothetical protein
MNIIEAFITGVNAIQGPEITYNLKNAIQGPKITYNLKGIQILSINGRMVAIRVHQGMVIVNKGQEYYGLIAELLDSLDSHHIEYHIVG